MSDQRLDELLAEHFGTPPGVDRLDNLESDVWRHIHAREAAGPAGRPGGWLTSLLTPRYRFAAVAIAVALGLLAGGMPRGPMPGGASSLQALDMQVFTAPAGYLTPSILAGTL